MSKTIHIVTSAAPDHSFYGTGSLLCFEIAVLKEAGASIILHTFGDKDPSEAITGACKQIFHYPLNTGHKAIARNIPYSAATCLHPLLPERLASDPAPILCYGWETAGMIMEDPVLCKRTFIRTCGIPAIQSKELFHFSSGIGKKIFYLNEWRRVANYSKTLAEKARFIVLHHQDYSKLSKDQAKEITEEPLLIPPQKTTAEASTGNYCLHFGDFSNPEQEKAAIWLLEHIFRQATYPCIIAGKAISPALKKIISGTDHLCFVEDPDENELKDLIKKAQILLFPMLSVTGLKPEIYNATLYGRHILYYGNGFICPLVKDTCHRIEHPAHALSVIESLFHVPLHPETIKLRNYYLHESNESVERAQKLLERVRTSSMIAAE